MAQPSESATAAVAAPPGGSFLFTPPAVDRIFSVEEFSEEQFAMAAEAGRFVAKEVIPKERSLESKEGKAAKGMVALLRKACGLGLAQVEIPEAYGGLGADKVTSLLIADKLGESGDFSVTWGAHSGIGLAPILYFGTDAQKRRWVPAIAEGRAVSCYALSEPESGSDALAARMVARLNPEGTHYILNGTKQWITNAAWADVAIVFAKVDGDRFTAFIVPRDTPGFTIGAEEHKLGLRGSSTCQLIFNDAPVPIDCVLGEVGKGHRVAFNTLNLGRYKLGGAAISIAKRALAEGIRYASDRRQFRTRVVDFGAIRDQIADSVIELYQLESLTYRIAGAIDARLRDLDAGAPDYNDQTMAAIEEYAIEASACKVFGSEAVGRIVDRALQWHGGYGFTEDYAVEKFVRDARVYRIFEGTNEINRLLIPGTLLKRAAQGRCNLRAALAVLASRGGAGGDEVDVGDPLAVARAALAAHKDVTLIALQAASGRFGMALDGEQESLVALADLITGCFAVDSAIARTVQRRAAGSTDDVAPAVCAVAAVESAERAALSARRVVISCHPGDAARPLLDRLSAFAFDVPVSLVPWRRQIAASAVEAGGYRLSTY